MHWGLVQDDTGLWLQQLGLQMREGNFVLAGQVLQLQSVAELEQDILIQSEPVVDLGLHSSDMFVGLSKEKSSLLLWPVAVGDLVLGSSVQHFVTQLMLKYSLHLGSVAQLGVRRRQH